MYRQTTERAAGSPCQHAITHGKKVVRIANILSEVSKLYIMQTTTDLESNIAILWANNECGPRPVCTMGIDDTAITDTETRVRNNRQNQQLCATGDCGRVRLSEGVCGFQAVGCQGQAS